MAGPGVRDILSQLAARDRISPSDHQQFLRNYQYFESQAAEIRQEFAGKWVAALNEQLYNDRYGRPLIDRILSFPEGRYAYIEQIPAV